jgi:hypothetical protein
MIERYMGRTIVVHKGDGVWHASIRRAGVRTDPLLPVEGETQLEALAKARQFVDGIPELEAW